MNYYLKKLKTSPLMDDTQCIEKISKFKRSLESIEMKFNNLIS